MSLVTIHTNPNANMIFENRVSDTESWLSLTYVSNEFSALSQCVFGKMSLTTTQSNLKPASSTGGSKLII